MHRREGVVRRVGRVAMACAVGVAGVGLWVGSAPAANADPTGIFLCVENASSQSVRIQWDLNRGSNDPGGPNLAPGSRRCAESTPWLRLIMRPGKEPIGGLMTWGVYARGTDVRVSEGAMAAGAWVDWRARVRWSQVSVGETRRATIPPPDRVPGGAWKFRLERFPNDEHVGGGSDPSGNTWIRYLLTINQA